MSKKGTEKKENKLGFAVFIVSILICVIAVSYAIWSQIYPGWKENKIDTATLILSLDESMSNGISLINTVPVSDEKGLTYTPYTFTVTNSGTTDANYRILLVNDTEKYQKDQCTDKMLNWDNIKFSFTEGNKATTIGNLNDTAGVLQEGTLQKGKTSSYSLKLWIKSEATKEIMNQHFHGIIKVEAIQSDQPLPTK